MTSERGVASKRGAPKQGSGLLVAARVAAWCAALLAPLAPVFGADPDIDSGWPEAARSASQEPPSPPRQIPGEEPRPTQFPPYIYESLPNVDSSASEFVPVPDRWRQFYVGKLYDPYNQNVLKGDIPVFGPPGEEWFLNLSAISDSVAERRRVPTSVGGASTSSPNSNDTFGDGRQWAMAQNFIFSASLIRGDTTFRPPDYEFRVTPAFNGNYADVEETGVLRIEPTYGTTRTDSHMGFKELFADVHLANVSDRYDFISSRIGIQKFSSDFRGFVFSDEEPGVRLFGNYDNNQWQYNLAWFYRLDKDTNSGLNTNFDPRYEQVFVANLFKQDAPVLGHTLEASVLYRADTAGDHQEHFNSNGFLVRPAAVGDEVPTNIHTTYFGLTGDGHMGRVNLTEAAYYATGRESHNQIAAQGVNVSAWMTAFEASYDVDWLRFRASVFWATGDRDPYDSKAQGFDAIFDNPNFAGGDLAYFQREAIPFIGGGGVNLVNAQSLLPDLRPGKEEGQSNFVNPGIRLYNLGVDVEVLPELKVINNFSFLQFDNPAVLRALRQDGSINRNIGFDLSTGILYRPFLTNNVQFRLGGGVLLPGSGMENLFGDDLLFDVFTNMTFQY